MAEREVCATVHPCDKCPTWGQIGPLQPTFQGLGVLAGETFGILHSSGLRCSSMVHLGLPLDALSQGTGEALTLGVGDRPLPQTDPRLFIYVNCFYTPRCKSAGAAVTSRIREESKWESPLVSSLLALPSAGAPWSRCWRTRSIMQAHQERS